MKNRNQSPLLLGTYSERIARTFARREGITVKVEGSGTPYADLENNTIVIPATIDALDPKSRRAFEGVLDHEVSHLRAEQEHPTLPASALMASMSQRQRWLFNVTEDVRIELDAEKRWPGVRTNLKACADWAFTRIDDRLAKGESNPGFLFGAGLIARARGWGDMMSTLWPADALALLDRFEWAVEEARTTRTPEQAADLALRIEKALEDEAEDERPEAPEEADGGEGEGANASDEEGAGGGGDADEGGADEGGEGEGKGVADAAQEALDAGAAGDVVTPAHDAEEGLAGEAFCAATGETGGVPRATPGLRDKRTRLYDRPLCEKTRTRCSKYVGGLANRLAMLLRAPKPRRTPDQESGRVDSRALSGVKAGRRRVFERRLPVVDNGTVVSILVDLSASMRSYPAGGGSRTMMEIARDAAFVLGEALDRAGIEFEISGWYETGGVPCPVPGFSRTEAHYEPVVKDFGESWRRVRGRIDGLHAQGNNDDAQAVWNASRRLVARPEGRRVLIVLSDGYPCHAINDADSRKQLRDCLAYAEAAGIETAGIGIASEAVSCFYENHEVVNDLSELARASIDVLGRTLRGRRAA